MIKRKRLPDDWTCEAGIDIDYSGIAPHIILCRKPAKLYGIITLCDEHKHILKKKPEED